jgi:hypothetical protein
LQIKYWRDRRNDCAHFKSTEISHFHVEAFWNFLESNLSKITVEGGMHTLLNMIERHYDQKFNKMGKDVSPLVAQISVSVDPKDLMEFWQLALSSIGRATDSWLYNWLSNFIDKVLALNNPTLSRSLIAFIKANNGLLLHHLARSPSFIAVVDYSPEEIREFWKTKLMTCNEFLDIYCNMLSNNLIPSDEVKEAHRVVLTRL